MLEQGFTINEYSLEAFLHCRYKSYQKKYNITGQPSNFDLHTAAQNDSYRRSVQSQLLIQHHGIDDIRSPWITFHTLQKGKPLIFDAMVRASRLSATIYALQRMDGMSLLGNYLYQPIEICYHDSPTKVVTILLAFKSLLIGELQGQIPTHGTLVFG